MRIFDSVLFMGNVQTAGEIEILVHLLDAGISIVNAVQQPSHSQSEEETQQDRTERLILQSDLESIVRDIAMALMGKEIEFISAKP